MRVRPSLGTILTAATLFAAANANAAIYALTPLPSSGSEVGIVDVDSLAAGLLTASDCCAVQSGAVSVDASGHVAYFIDNAVDGPTLVSFRYAAPASVTRTALGGALRITHMQWDPSRNRLIGIARDTLSEQLALFKIENGALSTLATLPPDCCRLRAAVSAYDSTADTLYVVTKPDTGNEQLLAVSFSTLAVTGMLDLAGQSLGDLVISGRALYALGHDAATATGRLVRIALGPSQTLTTIGAGSSDCCYVLAGPATIDQASNSLVVLAQDTNAIGSFKIRRARLDTGAISSGNALTAFGLFEDTVAVTDVIFSDGFE